MAGPYTVIVADCPWSYKDKCNAGKRGACHKYPVMTPEELKALPVSSLGAKDSALFLWATMPQLKVALDVMEAWGYEYKTVAFTWVKLNKKALSLFWGMGRWTRSNPEVVLLGTRGKPHREHADVHSVLYLPVGAHSHKPSDIFHKIERLMGDVPKVELFARRKPENWDIWGNEAPRDVENRWIKRDVLDAVLNTQTPHNFLEGPNTVETGSQELVVDVSQGIPRTYDDNT